MTNNTADNIIIKVMLHYEVAHYIITYKCIFKQTFSTCLKVSPKTLYITNEISVKKKKNLLHKKIWQRKTWFYLCKKEKMKKKNHAKNCLTCKKPPSQYVAFTSIPTLNFLKRNLNTQSLGAPRKLRKRYQHVIGLPRFWFVTSGDATSSYMSTVLLQWSLNVSDGPAEIKKMFFSLLYLDQFFVCWNCNSLEKLLKNIPFCFPVNLSQFSVNTVDFYSQQYKVGSWRAH